MNTAPTVPTVLPLTGRALEEFGAEVIKNEVFDQVHLLWERRRAEGWTQKQIAEAIGRDPGWVSRNLNAPGNWTVRTMGAFVQGLNGEIEIHIYAIEDALDTPPNYHAYDGYIPEDEDVTRRPLTIDVTQKPQKPYQLVLEYR
jgi:transcriptional regulator with XRE-family HTH domain